MNVCKVPTMELIKRCVKNKNMSKKRQIPHTYVIVFSIIIISAVATWIVPGGHYVKEKVIVDGIEKEQVVYEKVQMAKYFTSRAVVRAASDAVQMQGANGCNESSNVARYYRDSKIMEIIEGTTQIHERMLGKTFVEKAARLIKEKKN